MIQATAHIDGDLLVRFEATGHADHARGGPDIVCAAFTHLVRSTLAALELHPSLTVDGSAPREGQISFSVEYERLDRNVFDSVIELRTSSFVAGAGGTLITGCELLAAEYPTSLSFQKVQIKQPSRG